jgi:hypothetical protein
VGQPRECREGVHESSDRRPEGRYERQGRKGVREIVRARQRKLVRAAKNRLRRPEPDPGPCRAGDAPLAAIFETDRRIWPRRATSSAILPPKTA